MSSISFEYSFSLWIFFLFHFLCIFLNYCCQVRDHWFIVIFLTILNLRFFYFLLTLIWVFYYSVWINFLHWADLLPGIWDPSNDFSHLKECLHHYHVILFYEIYEQFATIIPFLYVKLSNIWLLIFLFTYERILFSN